MSEFDYVESEREKYETVWGKYPEYRRQADGDPVVTLAFSRMGCKPGESLIDWGCGKGTPAARFQAMGLKVTGFDIAKNCLDTDVHIPLVVGCIWDPPELVSDYAFCTDVLEHIPTPKLDLALKAIFKSTRKAAFLQVCTTHDTFGRKMDPPRTLHLTVMSIPEWEQRFRDAGWQMKEKDPRGKTRWWAVCTK